MSLLENLFEWQVQSAKRRLTRRGSKLFGLPKGTSFEDLNLKLFELAGQEMGIPAEESTPERVFNSVRERYGENAWYLVNGTRPLSSRRDVAWSVYLSVSPNKESISWHADTVRRKK